ncbi:MAG: thermonuclease family protein [Planctomycetota bacterium]|jgi:endonuclease YncB( thermonuclease family)|nr:thermonuclease family protein [Planctomycetota bacterium]MDP6761693.1 thermonuclease family protein [Planctomycetota bacterium]MDP6990193.1 thermonuclease family protein [Planctomycetota bacterium]
MIPALPLLLAGACAPQDPASPAPSPTRPADLELLEVVKVVDGDTLHVMRDGAKEKLRLLSVDTEEKFNPSYRGSPTKPQTVYGEECAAWAREFFAERAAVEGVMKVGLAFPAGVEERDIYGRLLCHVLLPDGTDFNLLLVEQGRSPYFNKYGNSRICHGAFVAAQARAREAGLGVWNPKTNAAAPGRPAVRRPYERLLPWWQARADAIDDYRKRRGERVVAADDADGLARAVALEDPTITVFGTPDRYFEEADGSLTVLFRASDRKRALRVRIAADLREAHASLDLDGLDDEFRQNYVYVNGRLVQGERGFELPSTGPQAWRRAGPEPRAPAPEAAGDTSPGG